MYVRSRYVKIRMEEPVCDCGELLQFTGRMITSVPVSYEYVCPVCQYTYILGRKYPVFITDAPEELEEK